MSKIAFAKNGKNSKGLQIHNQAVLINNIKNEIDIFGGSRLNARYKDIQKILTTTSIKVQDLKTKTHKQQNRDYCDEIQGQIQQSLQRLESRASFNAKNSFLSHKTENLKLPELSFAEVTSEVKNDCAWRLTEIDEETDRLGNDLQNFIELRDTQQLSYLEKQIRLLYQQLELVSATKYTQLGDKKLAIGKKLVKHYNQIKKAKRNIKRQNFKGPNTTSLLTVQIELDEVESAVSWFEGVTSDKSYLDIQQNLEWKKINLHRFSQKEPEMGNKSSLVLEKVNTLITDLKNKAEDTENRMSLNSTLSETNEIRCQVKIFKDNWASLVDKIPDTLTSSTTINILRTVMEEIDCSLVKIRMLCKPKDVENVTQINDPDVACSSIPILNNVNVEEQAPLKIPPSHTQTFDRQNQHDDEYSTKNLQPEDTKSNPYILTPKLGLETLTEHWKYIDDDLNSPNIHQNEQDLLNLSKISDPLEDLAIIENKIANIKVKLLELNALSFQDKFYQDICETIKSCVSEIDRIDAGNVAFVRERKHTLTKELDNCEKLLKNSFEDNYIHKKELQEIKKIVLKVREVESQIDCFCGVKNDKEYNILDEYLVSLMVELNNVRTYDNKILEKEKKDGIQDILNNLRRLIDKASNNIA